VVCQCLVDGWFPRCAGKPTINTHQLFLDSPIVTIEL
jgi:hypothetical protein